MKILDIPRSGSYQGIVSSRNRFGQYVRTRATPVNPNTTYQTVVRSRLAGHAASWRALTDAQREGWESLGLLVVRTDSLGQSYSLTGLQAFVMINNNKLAAGDAEVSDAPAVDVPDTLATITLTADASPAAFTVAYTPTPLPASTKAFIYCSPPRSAGRLYEGDYRLIFITATAAASPANILSAYTARMGALVTGQKINVSVATYRGGWLGLPINGSTVVVA